MTTAPSASVAHRLPSAVVWLGENRSVLLCVECGGVADDEAGGWRAYREDLPDENDPPSVAIFCPICAAREFDAEPAE